MGFQQPVGPLLESAKFVDSDWSLADCLTCIHYTKACTRQRAQLSKKACEVYSFVVLLGGICGPRLRGMMLERHHRNPLGLDVQILHVECIIFNKFPARLNVLAHQSSENGVSFRQILQLDPQQRPPLWIHCRLPKLR